MNRIKLLFCLSVLISALLAPAALLAQWSSDPFLNLGVGVAANDQVTAKMAACSDGSVYIAWFDNRSGGYCVYLQRLDADGMPQFPANGMLISNNPQMTWLVDWDMTVDNSNNAIIVFSDMRNGTANDLDVFAYKISPTGVFLWGANGVGLSPAGNTDFEPMPKVAATETGNVVVAWPLANTPYTVRLQKISTDGALMWGANGRIISSGTGARIEAPDLIPAQGDTVIVIWKSSTGTSWSPITHMYMQKYSPDGQGVWTTGGLLIYDVGQVSAWTYPEISTDYAGGAFVTWYDSPTGNFNVRVFHVGSAGNLIFPFNGAVVSTNSDNRLHAYPSLTYIPTLNAAFVFWTEMNDNQSIWGLYGQKFDASGNRMWTDNGHEFIPMGVDQIDFIQSGEAQGLIYVSYFLGSTIEDYVKTFRINPDGTYQWSSQLVSSSPGTKDDLLMVVNSENDAVMAWTDGRNDNGDIYAQNITPAGLLGGGTLPDVTIELTPMGTPIVIPSGGGSFSFNVALNNNTATAYVVDVWTFATLPNGSHYGPIINVQDLSLVGGASVNRDRTQNVPANAPAGVYSYDAYIGVYPNIVYSEDHFTFTKSTVTDGGNISGWDNSGQDFTSANSENIPSEYALLSAYPNPFNPQTNLSFTLPAAGEISLKVFDISGREVQDLGFGIWDSGTHSVVWDASGFGSGIYFVRLETGGFVTTEKIILMK